MCGGWSGLVLTCHHNQGIVSGVVMAYVSLLCLELAEAGVFYEDHRDQEHMLR